MFPVANRRPQTISMHDNTNVFSPSSGDQESEIKVSTGLFPSERHEEGIHSALPSLACRLSSSPCVVPHGLPSVPVYIQMSPFKDTSCWIKAHLDDQLKTPLTASAMTLFLNKAPFWWGLVLQTWILLGHSPTHIKHVSKIKYVIESTRKKVN